MTSAPPAPPEADADTGDAEAARPGPLARIWRIYLVKRLVFALFAVWTVMTAIFFMVRAMPGDPVTVMAGKLSQGGMSLADAKVVAAQRLNYDPDANIFTQYFQYLGNLFQGDLGMSVSQPNETVFERIMDNLPWTIFTIGAGVVIAVVVGMTVGMVMAYRRNGVFDHVMTPVASTLGAVPNYLAAIALVLVGSTWLGLFDFWDMRGRMSLGVEPGFNGEFIGDVLYHAILPIVTFAFTVTGNWMLVMKASTTEVLGEDYVTVARARGLRDRRVATSYVARNSVLPLLPQIALAIGTLVGGAIIVEQVLQYDGVGMLTLSALNGRDYTVIQGVFLILTIAVVFTNLIVDLLNSWIDPRIRRGEGQEASA